MHGTAQLCGLQVRVLLLRRNALCIGSAVCVHSLRLLFRKELEEKVNEMNLSTLSP